jgi:hypothetical protein
MADDFYIHSARTRMDRIEAERSRALADLADAKASADYETAGYAVQTIANLDAEARNLASIHEQYVRSQTPVPPPEFVERGTPRQAVGSHDSGRRFGDCTQFKIRAGPRLERSARACRICRSSTPPSAGGMRCSSAI